MENLAVAFLRKEAAPEASRPLSKLLKAYEGLCGELTDQIIWWLGEERVSILYIEPLADDDALANPKGGYWSYHMVPVIDGLVHDAWFPRMIFPPKEYVDRVFNLKYAQFEIFGDAKQP